MLRVQLDRNDHHDYLNPPRGAEMRRLVETVRPSGQYLRAVS
jgi:hypothetical protein